MGSGPVKAYTRLPAPAEAHVCSDATYRSGPMEATPLPSTVTENTWLVSAWSAYPANWPVTVNGVEKVFRVPSGAVGIAICAVVNVNVALIQTDEYVVPFTCSVNG